MLWLEFFFSFKLTLKWILLKQAWNRHISCQWYALLMWLMLLLDKWRNTNCLLSGICRHENQNYSFSKHPNTERCQYIAKLICAQNVIKKHWMVLSYAPRNKHDGRITPISLQPLLPHHLVMGEMIMAIFERKLFSTSSRDSFIITK